MKLLKKSVLSLAASAAIGMSVFSSSYVFALDDVYTNDSDVPDTSVEVVWDMGNGINLGNTMESCGTWINGSSPKNFETAWGQPETTKEIIEGMKEAGFDSVRIPVAWSNMMSTDGNYTIDPAYLDRVEQIVKWVLEADMYAVVNDHWDSGWWTDFGTKDEALVNEAWKRYEAIWTQVGERFKDYSHKLIFESANEELGTNWNSLREVQRYKLITEINQKFVDIIRSQGSKNADRFLLIAGYNTNIDKTIDKRYEMPKDILKNHLMISVHYYDPTPYCLPTDPDNSWGYSDTWGTQSDIEYMKNQLAKMNQFTERGYGVIVGECGAFHQIYKKDGLEGGNDSSKLPAPVVKGGCYEWYDYVLKFCEEYNLCPMSWDCSEWYIRKELKVTDEKMAKIFKDNEFDPETAQKPPIYTEPDNVTVGGTVSIPGTDAAEVSITISKIDTDEILCILYATDLWTVELEEGEYCATVSANDCVERDYYFTVADEPITFDFELHILGDVDANGKRTTSDVGIINACAKGKMTLEDYDFTVADANNDGIITTADVGIINSKVKAPAA